MSETALITVSAKEGFLRSLIAGGAVEKLIPEDASSEDVLLRLRACVGADKTIRKVAGLVNVAIGRCLALAADRPEIWRGAGYDTWGKFVDAEAESRGVSHGTIWNGIKAGRVFKGMAIEQHMEDHVTNVVRAAYGLPPDASLRQKQEALAQIALPVAKYREWIEGRYGMTSGTTDYGEIKYIGTRAQSEEIREWITHLPNQRWAGTEHPLEMILAALHSASTEIEETESGIPDGHPAADLGWEETLG